MLNEIDVQNTWLSWSSGKDSAWALQALRQSDEYEVTGLFTTINMAFDRVAMHAVRVDLLRAQAEAVGLPLYLIEIPYPCSPIWRGHHELARQCVAAHALPALNHCLLPTSCFTKFGSANTPRCVAPL